MRLTASQASQALQRACCSSIGPGRPYGFEQIRCSSAATARVAVPALSYSSPITDFSGDPLNDRLQSDEFSRGYVRNSPLSQLNNDLVRAAESGNMVAAFGICQQIKSLKLRPDVQTYNNIMKLFAIVGQHESAFAILTDMDAVGVKPDIETFNLLVLSSRFSLLNAKVMLDRMKAAGIQPTAITYHHLITAYADTDNLEMALQTLEDMHLKGLPPTLQTAELVIGLATKFDHARLALDLAYAYERHSLRRLSPATWMRVLSASAHSLFLEGVEQCWQKAVIDYSVLPDEGLCIEVLHVAGRHGKPELASEVLRVMSLIGAPIQEHHLAPLLEAFCLAARLKDALSVLTLMRTHAIVPTEETTLPLFSAIVKSVEDVDKAFYALEELHNEGKTVDICAINAIVHASVSLNDLQRAVGTYKECERLGVKPNVETFNYLLSACIAAKHRALGEKLLTELKLADLKPNAMTLERMVILSLTQPSYEEAFYYLEELKERGKVPQRVYEAVIRKCVTCYDPRWKLAAEEMQQNGYTISTKLLRFIEEGREVPELESRPVKPRAYVDRYRNDKRRAFLQEVKEESAHDEMAI